jgi:heme/copper-type cytochrome/quinol oxidase subunit 1
MVTPFSARTRFTAVGKSDIGLMGVFLALNASIVSSANFLVTYRYLSTLNNRKMRDARSFFSEGLITASWMMIAANPMLAIAILMLISDRHWQTSFFDYSGGGILSFSNTCFGFSVTRKFMLSCCQFSVLQIL